MSVVKHFVEDSIKKAEINEFLQNEFERAGYGGVSITKTPLGTHLVIYTMRPGLVIGRGGETIRALASILEEKFDLPSPQISVAEIEIPELNAHVVASKVTSALKRGVHYRRAGFWSLNRTMEAGALGAEIIISGIHHNEVIFVSHHVFTFDNLVHRRIFGQAQARQRRALALKGL